MKKNHEGKTPKMSKTDRFAQMTQQERLIEEKKREIQNKLEARRRQNIEDSKRERAQASQPKLLEESSSSSSSSGRPNAFSNDGSFLEQFKQLKEKKMDNKSRALNKYNDRNRWNKLPGQSSSVVKPVRFSLEKQQITITTKTTFPSQSQSNPEEPKIEVPNPPLTSENNQQPSTVTQQLSLQQSSASIYQNTDQNVDQQQVIFTPPHVQQIQPEFTVNPPQNQPQFSISQPQTEASPQIIQQFNTLPPQINQLQPSIQVLNTQNQEITVQQHLVAPQTQIYQPIQVQQGGVQQVHLQAIQGTEGSLSLIQQPIGNQQVLLNVPPPQLVQTQLTNIVLTSQAQNVLVSAPTTVQLTTLTLPPPVLTGQTVELASIPPPNPIQVQNIPQPEPLNTMNIPPPAPLQVQNIPTPTTLHMNQIPDPKPLDLLNIPTPNNGHEFLKNIPPPNKSVPPPHAGVQFMSGAPQEVLIHTLPPSNQIQSSNLQIQDAQQGILAPQGQIQVPSSLHSQIQLPSSLQGTIQLAQNQQPQSSNLIQGQISVSNLMQGPPNSLQGLIQTPNSNQLVLPNQIQDPSSLQSQIQASISLQRPPSMLPNESSPLPPTPQPQNQPPNFQNRPGSAPIPSLMSMPVMPPPGMEMNMPPPPISRHSAPPPGFDQMGRGMAPMSVPPPMGGMGQDREMDYGPDMFNVFPPGSKIFEAMSSLARMVVDCGPSIEDVVKEKKNRDPDLWFLFQKDSAAYSQYQDLIEQYKREKDDSMRHNERDRSFDRERSYEREDRYGRERRGDRYDRDRREDRYDREQREDRYEREQRGARYEREQRDDRYKREQREDRYERELQEDRYEREQMEERYESEQDNDWQDDNRDRRNSVPELKVEKNDEPYEPEMALEDDDDEDSFGIKQEIKQENNEESVEARNERKRKRKSRWGEKDPNVQPPAVVPVVIPTLSHMPPLPLCQPLPMLSKVTRMDPGLMQYVVTNYGSTNLEEDTWKKAEENYKIHLLYQDMMKKRAEVERLAAQGKNKYEYDSDEDTDGGTWEHKLRIKEMTATEKWATELNKQAEGKHHIGDFLPPEELKRFMENCNALKEGRQPNFSDYKEFKIKEDNVGFKMLQKLGWSEGQGLGQNNTGIVEPVNKGAPRADTQGLGLHSELSTEGEDEYETYRKRMMLAYRFRPNPLNNPRRPYY